MSENEETIYDHYGISEEEFNDLIFSMLKDLVTLCDKSVVLDKLFPNLDNKDKIKIIAYGIAHEYAEKIEG